MSFWPSWSDRALIFRAISILLLGIVIPAILLALIISFLVCARKVEREIGVYTVIHRIVLKKH